jgi:hypothetical protein
MKIIELSTENVKKIKEAHDALIALAKAVDDADDDGSVV